MLLSLEVMLLFSCADNTPDVHFYVEVFELNYDPSMDATHIKPIVMVDNHAEERDISAYKFTLSFYSSADELLDTKECERSGIRIAPGDYDMVEWDDYGSSDGFYISGNVATVTVTPVTVSFHSGATSSGSGDDGRYGAKDDVSAANKIWGWRTFALGVICAIIAIALVISVISKGEESIITGYAVLLLLIATFILFIISGALLGGFDGIGIYWLFFAISWIVWLIATLATTGYTMNVAGSCAIISIIGSIVAAAAMTALTIFGLVWLFWVLFVVSIVVGCLVLVVSVEW